MSEGVKHDQDKPPMALLSRLALEGLARVLGFGAKKYAADNWRDGIKYRRLISAAYRHLGALQDGEDIDPESGLPHVDHLGCCWMFLSEMMATRPDMDDRWKRESRDKISCEPRPALPPDTQKYDHLSHPAIGDYRGPGFRPLLQRAFCGSGAEEG